jgi:hypothetical protein
MTKLLLAEFTRPEAMLAAARNVDQSGCRLADAFTPFPIEEMAELLDAASTSLRVYMFIGGLIFAAGAYATESLSAVYLYPFDSGGRPLYSWATFVMFPFAIGIFGAALIGFIVTMLKTGLPRLHHPLFSFEPLERATQDRFILALEPPHATSLEARARAWLIEAGAIDVTEAET